MTLFIDLSGDTLLFAWLVVCNVSMRTALTMFLVFDICWRSMIADLTER